MQVPSREGQISKSEYVVLCAEYGPQDYKRGDDMNVLWYWETDDILTPFFEEDSQVIEPLFRAYEMGNLASTQRVTLSFSPVAVDFSQMSMKSPVGFVYVSLSFPLFIYSF